MRDLLKQLLSTAGAAFAGACCAGTGWALAAASAIGAGFLTNHAILMPLFFLLFGIGLWFLWRSASAHKDLKPFYLGTVGVIAAIVGLWTSTALFFGGLLTIVASSLWDFLGARGRSLPKEQHERHR